MEDAAIKKGKSYVKKTFESSPDCSAWSQPQNLSKDKQLFEAKCKRSRRWSVKCATELTLSEQSKVSAEGEDAEIPVPCSDRGIVS